MDAHSLNFSEKYWENPEKFDPNRFAEGARQVPCSLFRFGMGPRKCLGYRYALVITRVVVASVLQKYTVQLADVDAPAKVKAKGITFDTPYLCPEIIFHERQSNKWRKWRKDQGERLKDHTDFEKLPAMFEKMNVEL